MTISLAGLPPRARREICEAAMKKKLTPRQQEVLDALKAMIERDGWPPTRKELADYLGLNSPNAAQELLEALESKGHITITPKVSRGIRISA